MDITVTELKERLDKGEKPVLIDVREPYEYETDHISEKNIPLNSLPDELKEWEDLKDKEVILYCRSGGRSGRAAEFLKQQGFANARNLAGGMKAWKEQVDPGFKLL